MTNKDKDIFFIDSCRRDFTINALAMKYDGTIVDYHNGAEDIKNGVLKFIGDPEERIKEDALRILRFFRFLSKFETFNKDTIDEPSLTACIKHADLLDNISIERIRSELFKILVGNHASEIIKLMKECDTLIPGTSNHLDTSHLKRLRGLSGNPLTAYISMFYKRTKTELGDEVQFAKHQSEYWKLSNAEQSQFQTILTLSKIATDELELKKVLTRDACHLPYVLEFAYLEDNIEFIHIIENWDIPTFPVKGQDLLDTGLEPNHAFGLTLLQMRKSWENSEFTLTKEELLEQI